MLSAERSRRYRERKRANANVNVNLDQSNISNRGRPRLRRTSENESVVQERQGNPLAEIRNRFIVNVDINLEQVVADDNIRLRDRENDDEPDEFERRRRQINSENRALRRHAMNNFESNNINEHYLGEMNVLCRHCNAKHFQSEKVNRGDSFNDCCGHESVELPNIPDFLDDLQSLLENTHVKSRIFFEHIRNYNSSFSFASFNPNLVNKEYSGTILFQNTRTNILSD